MIGNHKDTKKYPINLLIINYLYNFFGSHRTLFYSFSNSFLNYLIGILNSKLTVFWFNTAFLNIDSIFPHIQKNQLEAIPIVQADRTTHKNITSLVDKILAAKNTTPQADTSEWENDIDRLVYQLYGLNEEEIWIVERS